MLKSVTQAVIKAVRSLPAWVTLLLVLSALANLIGLGLGELPGWVHDWLDWLSSFAAVFLAIFIEAVPFLLLGTLSAAIVEVFIDREEITRWVPSSRFLGVLAGSLVGLAFPAGECGVVPLTRRLISKGMPVFMGMATLLAGPVLNPIVIAGTLAAFGPGLIFWGRLGLSLAIAVVTGLVFSLHRDPASLLRQPGVQPGLDVLSQPGANFLPALPSVVNRPRFAEQVRRMGLVAVDEFFEMGSYLVLGAGLAAAMQTIVPQSALLNVDQGPLRSVLALTGLAGLLSTCSIVDAFTAQAFTATFPSGSILAFLVFGPMVDIKRVLMFLRLFKPRTVAYLILLVFLLTLILTVFINYFGQGW